MTKFKHFKQRILRTLFPKFYIQKIYHKKMGEKLDFKNLTSFNEKIQWIKLYELPNNSLVIRCADKYQLPQYLTENGLQKYAVPIIGAWETFEQIPIEKLPKRFVLKMNNASSTNLFIEDKKEADWQQIETKINEWLRSDYGLRTIERHYSKIPPKIIAEEYLDFDDDRLEYNFYCFHGEVIFCNIIRFDNTLDKQSKDACYTPNWEFLDFHPPHYQIPHSLEKPDNWNEMLTVCNQLNKNFLFVRIDFIRCKDRTVLNELTFSPASGFDTTFTKEAQEIMGSWLDLTKSIHYKRN